MVGHPDDAIGVPAQVDVACPTLSALAEQLLVDLVAEHHHAGATRVFLRRPRPAVLERHVEHAEEVGVGGVPCAFSGRLRLPPGRTASAMRIEQGLVRRLCARISAVASM